jgi:non-heme chloroperoxidase
LENVAIALQEASARQWCRLERILMSYLTTSDATKIYYNDIGQGEPVVLIHGWPLNSDMWEYQRQALVDRGFRVISYDRRGFGKSSQPIGPYDYDTFAADLKALMEELDLNNARLVGFSMGGGEIARYLARYGAKRVAKAALISSVVPYVLKTADNPEGADESALKEMITQLKEDRPKFLAGFTKQFFGVGMISHPVSPEMMNWASYLAFQASPKATIDCVNAFGKTDFRPDLKAFTIPTLVIHGTADKNVPIGATGDAAAKGIANAKYLRYEGAPHGLFITHKNQLIEDLVSFL